MKRMVLGIFVLISLLLANTPALSAQNTQFGQNLVRYRECDLLVLHGPRVDVFYCPGEEQIGRLTIVTAEEVVDTLLRKFRIREFRWRPQISVYATHHQFEQNHMAEVGEGVLGVTTWNLNSLTFSQFNEKKIIIPFNRDYEQFRHTVSHELVHYFMFLKIEEVYRRREEPDTSRENDSTIVRVGGNSRNGNRVRTGRFLPVLWYAEGLAEYWGGDQDARDYMIIRDLTLNNQIPDIETFSNMNDYIAYPLGRELVDYLSRTYGEDKIAEFFENMPRHGNFITALQSAYRARIEDISSGFKDYLRRRFLGAYGETSTLSSGINRIKTGHRYAFNPLYYDNPEIEDPSRQASGTILYITPEDGYATIYRLRVLGTDSQLNVLRRDRVLRAEGRVDFESLHFPQSRLDVSRDHKLIFVSKRFERDVIHVFGLDERREITWYDFPGITSIRSPAWDPNGEKIVFTGTDSSGIADLYVWNTTDQSLAQLTNDDYSDENPVWSPDGKHIAFSSDRTSFGMNGFSNLFLYDLETGQIRYLTFGRVHDETPRFSRYGERVIFSSDRVLGNDSLPIFNLYEVDLSGNGCRLTDYVGGAFEPGFVDDSTAIFTGYENHNYHIYSQRIRCSSEAADSIGLPQELPAHSAWAWFDDAQSQLLSDAPSTLYTPRFRLQLAKLPEMGGFAASGIQGIYFSSAFIANDAQNDRFVYSWISVSRLFGNEQFKRYNRSSAGALYFNIARRLQWAIGAFDERGLYYDPPPIFISNNIRRVFLSKETGILGQLSYPLSRFKRVQVSGSLRYSSLDEWDYYLGSGGRRPSFDAPNDPVNFERSCLCLSAYFSVIADNSFWLETGPISGARSNLTLGFNTDFTSRRIENYTLSVDLRRYFRLGLRSAYAVQVFGHLSNGPIPQRISLGGSTDGPRLYDPQAFYTDRAWLWKQEVRFHVADIAGIQGPILSIVVPNIQGAIFFDVGQFSLKSNPMGNVWGSYGLSFRVPLFYGLNARIDTGRRFYLGNPPDFAFKKRQTKLWLGFNF